MGNPQVNQSLCKVSSTRAHLSNLVDKTLCSSSELCPVSFRQTIKRILPSPRHKTETSFTYCMLGTKWLRVGRPGIDPGKKTSWWLTMTQTLPKQNTSLARRHRTWRQGNWKCCFHLNAGSSVSRSCWKSGMKAILRSFTKDTFNLISSTLEARSYCKFLNP